MIDAKELGIRHVSIIMDGNGRWAKKRLMPRKVGHQAGGKTFREISDHGREIGLEVLTVYAFSTENWNRPQDEVDAIMNLMRDYIHEVMNEQERYLAKQVRIRFIGDRSRLDRDIREDMGEIEKSTEHLTKMALNIAVNYGGRLDILQSVQQIFAKIEAGDLSVEALSEELIADHLYTAGQPDPDLILRTGGEYRLSNFLLWQAAYAEYMATPTLWPDFKPKEMDQMLLNFAKRERRFGGVERKTSQGEQV